MTTKRVEIYTSFERNLDPPQKQVSNLWPSFCTNLFGP
jgi:hypothetical protein